MQKIKHIQAISLAALLLGGCADADHTPEKAVEAQTIAQQACTALYAKNPQAVGSFDDCYGRVANGLYNGKTLSMLAQGVQSYREEVCTGGTLRRNAEKWKSCVAESKLTLAGIDTILQGTPKEVAQEPLPTATVQQSRQAPTPQSGHARVQQQQCLAEGLQQGTTEYAACIAEVQKVWEKPREEPKTKCEEYGLKKGTIDYANCMIIQDQITEQARQREQMMMLEAEMQQRASDRESNNAMMGLGIGLLTGSLGAPPPSPQTHCTSYMVGQHLMTDCR